MDLEKELKAHYRKNGLNDVTLTVAFPHEEIYGWCSWRLRLSKLLITLACRVLRMGLNIEP